MSKPEKKLFLLDAMALIYRAHFAFSKNPRINSKGVNTGATYGFTNSLLEILQKEKPTHIAVAIDTKAPTFRHKDYTDYKANRQEQPEDIESNIPFVIKMVEAFNIPLYGIDGYEADDVIGTLAKKASKAGFEVFMMTPDKDYSQLVEEHVYLYKPAFMGKGVEVLGEKEVIKKWEIENPDQVRDILGLWGDSVDNIPGIPGIGEKTAKKLIQQYGSVENLVEHADELKGKQKENVIEFGEQGILSKKLATIAVDVPIEFNEEDLRHNEPNNEQLIALLDELEFRTTKKRLFGDEGDSGNSSSSSKKKSDENQIDMFMPSESEEVLKISPEKENIQTVKHQYYLIDSESKRKNLIRFLSRQEEFCFDTETTDINAFEAEIVGLAISYNAHEAYYIPMPQDQDDCRSILSEFKEIFENERILKIGQNLKYDITILLTYGIEVKGALFDTMLAHYLIEPDSRHNMDALSENYLNYTPVSIETLIGKKGKNQGNMRDADPKEVAEYAGEDADITLQLKYKLERELKSHNQEKLFNEVETPLVKVLSDMEVSGVKVDRGTLKEISDELGKAAQITQDKIFKIAGAEFNIASPKQLGEILFDKMKLVEKPKKTKTGQYATGEEILSQLANNHEIASLILDFREYQKLKSTYVDALPELISQKDGRIHTSYNQAVAATGRLSSTNPNLQNIPIRTEKGREIRKAFIPGDNEHILLSADYSQIELRIMAAFAEDKSMLDAFENGIDIHSTTASKIFKVELNKVDSDMRRKAKVANFGIIYGISAFGLSQRLNIPRKEAAALIEAYFNEFPNVKKYMDDIINSARENEYVETILGRRRYLRDINSRNQTQRGFAERNAINAPIQGSAADMIKVAMIKIHDWMKSEKMKSKMILQVHDELVFDVYKNELDSLKNKVEDIMKNAIPMKVAMEIGMGTGLNWLEAH
ncbi:DNA polymerase I [Hyphobacterium sp. CCMP332]|nr:DNA polymerase I [Hyphobacterium sp. CCMP332]